LVQEKDAAIRNLRSRLESRIAELAAKLQTALKEKEESESILHQHQTEIAELQKQLSFVWGGIAAAETKIEELHERHREELRTQQLRNEELLKQKDAASEALQADLLAQLTEEEALLSKREERVHVLQKLVAALSEERQMLEEELNALKQSIPPPPLSPIRERIVEELRRQPPHQITIIIMDEGGKGSADYGLDMRSTLELAGWTVKMVNRTFARSQFYGIQIVTDPGEGPTGRILIDSFRKAGVRFTELKQTAPQDTDPLCLVVGKTNW
jgi:hypothetical protein